ncbi:MAG: cytochrome d ubiquinol oxidase subunit II, partial [Planctomycetota bacterium]|nr:cytochrome d ubiquinol oxidase subunit II [Planctomycetota bacterium]
MDLNIFWFLLLGVLLAGYAMLDGFDLGAGILHFAGRSDHERRIILNAVGPLWDGNEVWLVTFGGAMFAAFPEAYATSFSGFYAAFMAVLFALIFRAVSIEFRGKVHSARWRFVWDVGFSVSGLVATFVFGVAVGAAISGVPLNQRGIFIGGVKDQLHFYSVLVGLMAVTLFAVHGAAYLILKTDGELRERLYKCGWTAWGLFLICYL